MATVEATQSCASLESGLNSLRLSSDQEKTLFLQNPVEFLKTKGIEISNGKLENFVQEFSIALGKPGYISGSSLNDDISIAQ